MAFDLSDYVDAKTKIKMFWSQFPNGSIVTSPPQPVPGRDDMIFMITRIYADRAQTELIATGTAAELVHGKTSYTKDSEVMNCETSAIARACSAAGIGITKSMASLEEVVRSQELQEKRATSTHGGGVGGWSAPPAPHSEPDPWEAPVHHDVQHCVHGAMVRKTGVKKNGDPYAGWVCNYDVREEQCKAIWD